jgi:hypothetical protein
MSNNENRSILPALVQVCAIVFVGSILVEYVVLWLYLNWQFPKRDLKQLDSFTPLPKNQVLVPLKWNLIGNHAT